MPKFKMKLKLQGFELEVEGERGDIPMVAHHLGQQFTHLLQPAASIAERASTNRNEPLVIDSPSAGAVAKPSNTKTRAKRASSSSSPRTNSDSDSTVQVYDWRHDPSKWGSPQSSWSVLQKCIYVLYVAEQENLCKEMTGGTVERTFNKHFRQAGLLRLSNVLTSLNRAKVKKDSPVGQDTRVEPAIWFLTDIGKKTALELVVSSKNI